MLKVVQVTDTHFEPPGTRHLGLWTRPRFEAAIRSINDEHGDASLVVITGDLAALGQTAAYREFRECLTKLQAPYKLLLGNGDHRDRFRAVFDDYPGVDENGFVQSVLDTEEGRLLFLDTVSGAGHWGELCEKRLSWLEARLDEVGRNHPLLLFMHHPPFKVGLRAMDRVTLRGADRFAELLRGRNVRHLFFGHLHRAIAGSWNGMPISVLRSTVAQVALLLDSDEFGRSFEDPQYAVVLVEPDQVIVHFHDYLAHDIIVAGDRPPIVSDDEHAVYDRQAEIKAGYYPLRDRSTGQRRLETGAGDQ